MDELNTERTINKEKYIMSSVDTALRIFNLFFDHEGLTATEVGRLLGTSRSTAFRFLVTLENQGFLIKREDNKYRLGIKFFTLGQLVSSRVELISFAHPFLQKISAKTGETAHLCIMDGTTHVAFVDKTEGNQCLVVNINLGTRRYAHLTAAGKAILAYETQPFLRKYCRAVHFTLNTPNSIIDAKQLEDELKTVRENGYACDNEEYERGLLCYGVPIFGASGQPIGAISSSGPKSRMIANEPAIIDLLKETSDKISNTFPNAFFSYIKNN